MNMDENLSASFPRFLDRDPLLRIVDSTLRGWIYSTPRFKKGALDSLLGVLPPLFRRAATTTCIVKTRPFDHNDA